MYRGILCTKLDESIAFSRSFLHSLTAYELYSSIASSNMTRARIRLRFQSPHPCSEMAIVPKAQVQRGHNASTSALSY